MILLLLGEKAWMREVVTLFQKLNCFGLAGKL